MIKQLTAIFECRGCPREIMRLLEWDGTLVHFHQLHRNSRKCAVCKAQAKFKAYSWPPNTDALALPTRAYRKPKLGAAVVNG